MSRPSSLFRPAYCFRNGTCRSPRLVIVAILVLIVVVCLAQAVSAQGSTIKLQRTLSVDRHGDAQVHLEIKMTTAQYTAAKSRTTNVAVLLRRLGNGQHWSQLDNVTGKFDDNASSIVIEYVHRGIARPVNDDVWEIELEQDAEVDVIGVFDRVALFNTAAQTDLGLASLIVRIEAPETSEDLEIAAPGTRITYRLAHPQAEGGQVHGELVLDAKSRIMSCLAKSYGNETFTYMWAARSIFKNTGDQVLKDYRVRFRIAGYSDWSPWMTADAVVPGQTVVDPFFPVFDLEKLAAMTGPRPATLEVEYEYQRPDGETVHQTDARRVELLSRNEVVFSSLAPTEIVSWHDAFDYGPAVLASFVTCNDPAIQQLAGRISGMAGGVAASTSDEEAVKFLKASFEYLGASRVAYQTPPGLLVQGHFGQHIKYGRDVLRNRAGTCIDLAILYGSLCEAVGLEPVLFLVPGHCFPAVKLPGGDVIPLEATMIGRADFGQAIEAGVKNVQEAAQSGMYYRIDIKELHDLGVRSLDLPSVEPDYLEKLGYRFDDIRFVNSGDEEVTPRDQLSDTSHWTQTQFPTIDLKNELDFDINFEINWGGEWKAGRVEAGNSTWYWYEFGSPSEQTPPCFVRFDADPTEGVSYKIYKLSWTVVADPNRDDGTIYRFRWSRDRRSIELFRVNN